MIKPNYKNGSIVNLMSSIGATFGWRSPYGQLKLLPAKMLKTKNVILLVIDGLGYDFLQRHGDGSFLKSICSGHITSVFPSTTPVAVTTFSTGLAPQQHAITGWRMFFKEISALAFPLPFVTKTGPLDIDIKLLFNKERFVDKIKAKTYTIQSKEIYKSVYSRAVQSDRRKGYRNMASFFRKIRRVARPGRERKYIYAYWMELDHLMHYTGANSEPAVEMFKKLDRRVAWLAGKLKDTALIVISDHGQIDTPRSHRLSFCKHPKLEDCLVMRPTGDSRTIYCYVYASKAKAFESYVKTQLSKDCLLFKSEELLKKGYFGIGRPDSRLRDRIGDYILVAKGGASFWDFLKLSEKHHFGSHSGLSREEMLVPLCVIRPG